VLRGIARLPDHEYAHRPLTKKKESSQAAPELARRHVSLDTELSILFRFLVSAMPATAVNKKRAAPAAAPAPAASKKRKTDGMQKFYAVKAGFKPGVYLTYVECQAQTAGFKGAVCESIHFFCPAALCD
jgi:hypothetical protein